VHDNGQRPTMNVESPRDFTMNNSVQFVLDGKIVEITFDASSLRPTTTVLNYLRGLPNHRGVKEGCAEGDCGACTVVIGELEAGKRVKYTAVDSCLMFLPMLHGKQLITIENLKTESGDLHPVQQALVDAHGSQCGYCTPGIVMTMFALYKNAHKPPKEEIANALAGNLCRCTGYRPILDAAADACSKDGNDQFSAHERRVADLLRSISRESVSVVTDNQRYDQPATVQECLTLLEEYPDAILVNGATDVALRATKRFEVLPHVIDCSRIEELRKISSASGSLTIGAGTRVSDVMTAVRSDFPAFHQMLTVFAARQIQNVATLGGNIGTASPVGDTLPVLIAYGASIVLRSRKGERIITANEFAKGYRKTERRADELIIAVVLPRPSARAKIHAYKISKRRDLDIATVSAAFRIEMDERGIVSDIALAYGGMAECTKRSIAAEAFLKGKPWNRRHVEEAQQYVDSDFTPISDVRGSTEFRRVAARNLLLKFWSDTST
jgi:xanthine dehydrogenase small subunit